MDITSTPFISFQDVNVDDTDLYEDAWGLKSEFSDVYSFLGKTEISPGDCLVDRIMALLGKRTES